ncbi:hypothetical protein WJX72_010839 [[Myrmecia] bisecta]|uniref:Mediator of RNA polymerase II transcription subunit 29 n=1 Tax=[Myrmecia] bisecta TaxID=41462 RepID=A0AAW1P2X4_9CHLO
MAVDRIQHAYNELVTAAGRVLASSSERQRNGSQAEALTDLDAACSHFNNSCDAVRHQLVHFQEHMPQLLHSGLGSG